jgi:hypothetical protein
LEILELEKKEMELLKRLQNTQELQKKALVNLDQVIGKSPSITSSPIMISSQESPKDQEIADSEKK